MTTQNQTMNVAYAPPAAVAAKAIVDAANAKTKVIGYPLSPTLGTPAASTWQLDRALSGAALAKLLAVPTNPLAAIAPSSQAGFALYRQCPTSGLAQNLLANGGHLSGSHGWTVNANTVTYVVDATSPTGYAARFNCEAAVVYSGHYQVVTIEAGKAYSMAAQLRSDGSKQIYIQIDWLDAVGNVISNALSSLSAPSGYTEFNITNATAPANAARARCFAVLNGGAGTNGIGYATAMRLMQQTTAPAAWTAAHQQYVQRGYWSSSTGAQSSLLTNPDVETAVSGNADGLNDPLANLNEWVLLAGNTFTVAANVVSNAAGNGNRMGVGHPDWWDSPSGSRIRFKWVTGGDFRLMVRYTDANNYVFYFADGAVFRLYKVIAGVQTQVATIAAVLTNGNFYWFQWQIAGTAYGSTTLDNDTAGAPGANVATLTSQTIADAAVTYGMVAVEMNGGTGMQFGGNFASVVRVKIPGVTGWTRTQAAGLSAFAVSKVLPFAGVYSLSVIQRNAADDGYWINAFTSGVSTLRSIAARAKVASGGGTGALVRVVGGATSDTNAITGTVDWTVLNRSAVTDTVATGYQCRLIGVGTAWFDNLWLVAEAYDTLNFEPSGSSSAVMPRAVSSCAIPLPTGFNVADFARSIVVRFESAYNANLTFRTLWKYVVDANNTLELYVDKTTGTIRFDKLRAGVGSSVGDAAATAFAAGDTVAIGVRHSATLGLELQVSKNGGAVATYSTTSLEAKFPIAGTPTSYLGWNGVAQQTDGTLAADRHMKSGLTGAQLSAVLLDPYRDQVDNDLAEWGTEGALYVIPVFDDRAPRLGFAYDYSIDATSAAPNAGTAFGLPYTATNPGLVTSWWLRSQQDPTKDVAIPVLDKHDYKYRRGAMVVEPAAGGLPSVIYTGAIGGMSGQLDVLAAFTTPAAAEAAEVALRALLASNDTIWLQTAFGTVYKVRLPDGIQFTRHEFMLDVKLSVLEVL